MKSIVMLPHSFFYKIIQDFTVLNVKGFCVWVITVPTVDISTAFTFTRCFYSLFIPVILQFACTLIFNWKKLLLMICSFHGDTV
jgi:hypothetical protein